MMVIRPIGVLASDALYPLMGCHGSSYPEKEVVHVCALTRHLRRCWNIGARRGGCLQVRVGGQELGREGRVEPQRTRPEEDDKRAPHMSRRLFGHRYSDHRAPDRKDAVQCAEVTGRTAEARRRARAINFSPDAYLDSLAVKAHNDTPPVRFFVYKPKLPHRGPSQIKYAGT